MRPTLVILTLIGAALPARAQSLTLGVHGGVNLARADGDGAAGDLEPLPVVGASVSVGFSGLALRVEAEYLRRGGRVTFTPSGAPTTGVDYSLTYFAIPINLRYDLTRSAFISYVFAGTTVGALLAAERRRDGGEREEIDDQLDGIDITLDLGGGLGYRVTPAVAVTLDARYAIGLAGDAAGDEVLDRSSWSARDVTVVLGVAYTFGAQVSRL